MTVGMPTADAFAAIRGSRAFLQGKVPGATSTKGPAAHARAVFGGALPRGRAFALAAPDVPPGFVTRCRTRP